MTLPQVSVGLLYGDGSLYWVSSRTLETEASPGIQYSSAASLLR